MNLQELRKDFPLLNPQNGQKPVIYLDTACQSLRPKAVIEAINEYYNSYAACSGRSMHHLAAWVTTQVDDARSQIAHFIGAAQKEEVLFTRNTTEGINLVANAFAFQPGDGVLVTGKEHNSNLIPWQMQVKKRGICLEIFPASTDGTFDFQEFEKRLSSRTIRLVSFGFSSNLDGVTLPAEKIIKLAHQYGALVLLDAAQTAPHHRLNVRGLDVDFLAFSGHKLLGPAGTGVLYGKRKLLEALEPFLVGGDTVANSTYEDCQFLPVPEKFEAGLQDYAGIIGLGAATRYLQKVGFETIQKQELLVNQAMSTALDIAGLHLIGPADPALRGGLFTFYIDGIDSHRIALMLDQMAGICVRSGQHCVHSWFNANHIAGSVRASAYFYNTVEEAEIFVENLKKIRKVLSPV